VIFLIFIALVGICVAQAVMSSMVNKGSLHWAILWATGILVSGLWVGLSVYSKSLVRDALIWDVLIAMVFTLVFIIFGHASGFETKYWFALAATFAVFIWWGLLK